MPVVPSRRARASSLRHRCDRPVPVRPGRGRPRPDPDHARARQAQGDRQGHPPAGVAARGLARAVRRAQRRAGPRPHVRRRDRGPGRDMRGSRFATASRARPPPGTWPSLPIARSRNVTRRGSCTRCCGGPTSCSTQGWRRAASRAGTRCICADELGQRPEVDRCVECDRMLEPDERFRWVRRWVASCAIDARAAG